jgi:hypothetical protein
MVLISLVESLLVTVNVVARSNGGVGGSNGPW